VMQAINFVMGGNEKRERVVYDVKAVKATDKFLLLSEVQDFRS
jgi:hypothetical protein